MNLYSALWILAAKSEMEDRNSSESARHLFLRALRFHPNNQKVYQEVDFFYFSERLKEPISSNEISHD